ncbi:MAG: aspartate--tRNA ligase [Myxococcota bacterium]
MSFLRERPRTDGCGDLRATHVDREVTLYGWVDVRRDHGGCVFVDLRDRTGVAQVVFKPEISAETHARAGELRNEFCIGVVGRVISRGANANPKLPTGAIEVNAERLEIFSRSEAPPFPIDDETDAGETVRLQYRYLDLRRPALQRNFLTRARVARVVRETYASAGFTEIETPFLIRHTPGGARNFLVPSRQSPGRFYGLAESPQIFKQLFMVAGFDRYFQIVKCFRDEDLRQDRQPEFTQIDVEMSFVEEDDVLRASEEMIAAVWREVTGAEVPRPIPRLTYDEAMSRYGSDKPDLRFGLELVDTTEPCARSGFRVFEQAIAAGGIVKGLRLPGGATGLSRSELDGLPEVVKPYGARGVAWAKVQEDGAWQAPFAKAFSEDARRDVNARMGARPGDVLCFVADRPKVANASMGALRLAMARKFELAGAGAWAFCWITDFPLLEKSEQSGAWQACHHPFTSPRPEDLEFLETDPGRVRARAYDLVINGNEIGGGSIRIHQPDVQARVFRAIGLSDEEAREKFSFLLEAFRYGAPPHGGIAFGLDRMVALLCGVDSLRDVIAFPKTQKGACLMTDAPAPATAAQLQELHVRLKE